MSTVTTTERSEEPDTRTRVTLGATMAKCLAAALSDEFSRRILVSTIPEGKTVQEISVEQAVPLSTCYRRARELLGEGLLVIERIVVAGDGKRYAIYRSSFKSVKLTSDFGEVSAVAELNSDVAEKVRMRSILTPFSSQSSGAPR